MTTPAAMPQPDWQTPDGAAVLYCADCRDVLPGLEGVDCVCVDPPYGTTAQHWDHELDWTTEIAEWHRLAGNIGNVVAFSQQPVASRMIAASPKTFRYELIWQKTHPTGFLSSGCRPLRAHENILVFVPQFGNVGAASLPCVYNPQTRTNKRYKRHHVNTSTTIYRGKSVGGLNGSTREYLGTHPTSVLTFARDGHAGTVHPNAKPVALLEWIVKSYTNHGQIVLDPYMGSGTTGVACMRTGRRFVGVEICENYFRIACRRIEEAWKEGQFLDGRMNPKPQEPDPSLFAGPT